MDFDKSSELVCKVQKIQLVRIGRHKYSTALDQMLDPNQIAWINYQSLYLGGRVLRLAKLHKNQEVSKSFHFYQLSQYDYSRPDKILLF